MPCFSKVPSTQLRSSLVGLETLFLAPGFVERPSVTASTRCHVINAKLHKPFMNKHYFPYIKLAETSFRIELVFSKVGLQNCQLMLLDIF